MNGGNFHPVCTNDDNKIAPAPFGATLPDDDEAGLHDAGSKGIIEYGDVEGFVSTSTLVISCFKALL
jgi:hypothetical protein